MSSATFDRDHSFPPNSPFRDSDNWSHASEEDFNDEGGYRRRGWDDDTNDTTPSPSVEASNANRSVVARIAAAHKVVEEATDAALRMASLDSVFVGVRTAQFSSPSTAESPVQSETNLGVWTRPSLTLKEFHERGLAVVENTYEGDSDEHLASTETDLRDLIASLADSSSSSSLLLSEEEQEEDSFALNRKARRFLGEVCFLRRCAVLRKTLKDADSATKSNDWLGCTRAVMEAEKGHAFLEEAKERLEKSSDGLEEEDRRAEVAQRILDSIDVDVTRFRADLRGRAASVMNSFFQIEVDTNLAKGSGSLLVREADDILRTAYDMAAEMGILEELVSIIAERISDVILDPLLKESSLALSPESTKPRGAFSWQFRERVDEEATSFLKRLGYPNVKSCHVHTLEWAKLTVSKPSNDDDDDSTQKHVEPWRRCLRSVRTILNFVHTHLCLGRKDLSRIMGTQLFLGGKYGRGHRVSIEPILRTKGLGSKPSWNGPLARRLLRIGWDHCVPPESNRTSASLLEIGKELHRLSCDFEDELVEKQFVQALDSPSGQDTARNEEVEVEDVDEKETSIETNRIYMPFTEFTHDLEKKYAEKRRAQILVRGREILVKKDFHDTITVGMDDENQNDGIENANPNGDNGDNNDDDSLCLYSSVLKMKMNKEARSVFVLSKCGVTRVAHTLLELCRNVMEEAVTSNVAPIGPHLYRAARDLFGLYRSVIPTIHGGPIATVPRTAATFHNDCIFFAQVMLVLGHRYRFTSKELDHPCFSSFVDLVPRFREMGDRAMVDMVELQQAQLAEPLSERVQGLSTKLRSNIHTQRWNEAETGVRAAHYHLRHLAAAWRGLLAAEVYGRVMGSLVDTLLKVVLDEVVCPSTTDISTAAGRFLGDLLQDIFRNCSALFPDASESEPSHYCQYWERMVAVRRFVDMNLAQIERALPEGVFQSVTGPELSQLIRASFNDSEKRRELLQALHQE